MFSPERPGITQVSSSSIRSETFVSIDFQRFCGIITMSVAAMSVAAMSVAAMSVAKIHLFNILMEICTMETKMTKLPATQEALAAMVALRYQTDADFRAEFDNDPKAVMSKLTGLEIPADSKIVVHRNDDKCWHISLPSAARTGVLKDEDISSVSGGARHDVAWSDLGDPGFWGISQENKERHRQAMGQAYDTMVGFLVPEDRQHRLGANPYTG
ncbi:MAG: hypothetical protein OXU34_02280 [Gammaproteobacteria bacterium]|nr:hypothetical protein [Gammaproteobacteria bacterium]